MGEARRKREVVDDVEHRNGKDGGDVEPERNVEAWLISLVESPEEVDRKDHPDDGNADVDGPDKLSVFFTASESSREGDDRGNDNRLPAPEVNF